jgi:hypothetical protein
MRCRDWSAKSQIGEGSSLEAAARVLVYIGKARHRVEERTFNALRKLLLAHPETSPAKFKAAVREQWGILAIDERAAIEALPPLLPADAAARRTFLDAILTIVTAAGDLSPDTQRRLVELKQLLETRTAKREKGQLAAE